MNVLIYKKLKLKGKGKIEIERKFHGATIQYAYGTSELEF